MAWILLGVVASAIFVMLKRLPSALLEDWNDTISQCQYESWPWSAPVTVQAFMDSAFQRRTVVACIFLLINFSVASIILMIWNVISPDDMLWNDTSLDDILLNIVAIIIVWMMMTFTCVACVWAFALAVDWDSEGRAHVAWPFRLMVKDDDIIVQQPAGPFAMTLRQRQLCRTMTERLMLVKFITTHETWTPCSIDTDKDLIRKICVEREKMSHVQYNACRNVTDYGLPDICCYDLATL